MKELDILILCSMILFAVPLVLFVLSLMVRRRR